MRFNKLEVKNYRNFKNEPFNLHPHFTVVIGANGSGKSSVLKAVRVAASAFILGIEGAKNIGFEQEEAHITVAGFRQVTPHYPVEVKVTEWEWKGKKQNKPFWRELPKLKAKTTVSHDHVGAIKDYADEISNKIGKGKVGIDCPLVAFFGTERLHGAGQLRETSSIDRRILKYGYENWFNYRSTTFRYAQWLVSLNHEGDPLDKIWRNTFIETVKTAIPLIDNLSLGDGLSIFLTVTISDETKTIDLPRQSDGIKVMFDMVAELAYRCIMLNGHLKEDAVKGTHGIVMIDELDIHLHPDWQRHVVQDLMAAFPNIQFVATSHSPFIVQSLEADQLLNLEGQLDYNPNELNLDVIVTEVMGVESALSIAAEDTNFKINSFLTDGSVKPEEIDKVSDPVLYALKRISERLK